MDAFSYKQHVSFLILFIIFAAVFKCSLSMKMKHLPLLIQTLLLAMLCCPLKADNYIYPVATGTSWAQDVFIEVEKAQQEANKLHSAPVGMPSFVKRFSQYNNNYRSFQLYEDSIFMDAPSTEWIAMFNRRARRYSEIYEENNEVLHAVDEYFHSNKVPDAAYDSLYFWTRHMYHNNMHDIFLIEQLVDGILIPHYESRNDFEHLELCYSYAGLVHYQFSRMGDPVARSRSLEYFQKAVDLRNHFAEFQDPLNRYYLISSFVNLCVLHTQNGNVSLGKAIQIHGQMWELFLSPDTRQLLDADPLLDEMAGWSLRLFCLRSIMTYISQGLDDPDMLQWLYWAYGEAKKQLGGRLTNLKHRYYAKIEYDEPIIEAFMGHISWNDAYSQFENMLMTDPELSSVNSMTVYRMNYMNNLFASHIFLIERTEMSHIEKSMAVKRMMKHVFDIIEHFEHIQFPFEKGEIIHNIATHPDLLKYQSTDEKRYLLYLLLVLEQPSNYVHVSMVAELAELLTSALIDERPDYFSRVPFLSGSDSIKKYKEELIKYVHHAALFHDVGKISMPAIVNNKFRSLTAHERAILQLHPNKANPYFAIDDDFHKYSVVAMGHQKWYNGNGYPESFDNVGSDFFPFINIVSICNFMDNAIENEGNNQHTMKSFEEVMQQLKARAGTQFDPVLVEFIAHNHILYEQMKERVYTSRAQHYYVMYRSFLDDGAPSSEKKPEELDLLLNLE